MIFLFLARKIIYLVLIVLVAILFALNHTAILFISALTLVIRLSKFSSASRQQVSSANISVNKSVELNKSFMKHKNRIGPRILPCRTEMTGRT